MTRFHQRVRERLKGRDYAVAYLAEFAAIVDELAHLRRDYRIHRRTIKALRAELHDLCAASVKNAGGTGNGAYTVSIALLEQKIRELEAECR